MEQTRRLSQEMRGNKFLHICLHLFQIIRNCVKNCCQTYESSNKRKLLFHLTNQLLSLGNKNQIFLVLNISLWFPNAAADIKRGSPLMFSLISTFDNLESTF